MDKPIILTINDLKAELAQMINKANKENGVPFYLMEPIIADVLTQVRSFSNTELEAARKQYEENK